MLMQFAI